MKLLNKIKNFSKKISKGNLFNLLLITGSCVVIALFIWIFMKGNYLTTFDVSTKNADNSNGIESVTSNVKKEIFIEDIEKKYFNLENKVEAFQAEVSAKNKQMADDQKFIGQYLEKITQSMEKIDSRLNSLETGDSALNKFNNEAKSFLSKNISLEMELEYVEIIPVNKPEITNTTVRLPMGSYCKGRLITGVHAPADDSKPLPVLIELTEAFVGPTNSVIPLKGTFILGKAYGDIVSKRAYIQIVGLSTVLPDGRVFEENGNLGYVGDIDSNFGIPGELIKSTGKELGLSFLTGFMSGAAQAFADAETTSVIGSEGQITSNVTGNATKNASFQGLASSASQLSTYYQDQIDNIVPSIRIDSGVEIHFYLQKGVTINGLTKDIDNNVVFIN